MTRGIFVIFAARHWSRVDLIDFTDTWIAFTEDASVGQFVFRFINDLSLFMVHVRVKKNGDQHVAELRIS